MYQFESRIRYSETGEDGCLTLTGMINYLQDCSIFLLRTFQFVVNIDYHIILQIKERNFPYS